MKIGKNYKIESDEMNITLYRRRVTKSQVDKPATEYWQGIGYYSTVSNALKDLIELEVRLTGMKDLQTVVDKVDELHRLIDKEVA